MNTLLVISMRFRFIYSFGKDFSCVNMQWLICTSFVLIGGAFGINFIVDPVKLRALGEIEKELGELLPIIVDVVDVENTCKGLLANYLKEAQDSSRKSQDNVLSGYKLIRRTVKTLLHDIIWTCWNTWPEDLERILEGIFATHKLDLPDTTDLEEAKLAVLRVQFVHGLASEEIQKGSLNGLNTGTHLDFDEVLELGIKSIEIGADRLAYHWMTKAQSLKKDTDLSKYWEKIKEISGKKTLKEMHKDLRYANQIYLRNFNHFFFHATCRGGVELPKEEQADLFCFYEKEAHPYFLVNPVKTEMLKRSPLILRFYEFVNDHTIGTIRKLGQTEMKRSTIESDNLKDMQSWYRTSMSRWVNDSEATEVQQLAKKISILTGLHVQSNGYRDGFEVTRYSWMGGHYDFHHDSISGEGSSDIMATFHIFLSDVKMGGNEGFPYARVYSQPVKGSAIMWQSLESNGEPLRKTLHGGCPVLSGIKEVATRWISYKENIWTSPCALMEDE